jgi:tetratricopeptide (TPR) repeat protein
LLWDETEKPNEAWAKRYYTDFGKALDSDHPPPRPEWVDANATEYEIATEYLALSEAAWQRAKALKYSKRRRKVTMLAIAAGVFLVLALVAVVYGRIAERERLSAERERLSAVEAQRLAVEAQKRAIAGEKAAEGERIITEISRATAVNLRRLFEAKAKEAEANLAEAERERALAESRGKVGQAFETVLFADAATTPKDVVRAYESMISYFERSGVHKTAARGTLDGLIVDAILKDNDSSVSDAFPYFREIYMRPSENNPRTLGHVNIKFAQRIIESGQRENAEAIQFLQAGIEKLDDQKDADEKAGAFMQLGEVFPGDSDQASQAFSSAAGLLRSKGKTAEEAAAREKLAETYKKRGDPLQALEQYQEALRLFGKVSDQAGISRITAQMQILAGHP